MDDAIDLTLEESENACKLQASEPIRRSKRLRIPKSYGNEILTFAEYNVSKEDNSTIWSCNRECTFDRFIHLLEIQGNNSTDVISKPSSSSGLNDEKPSKMEREHTAATVFHRECQNGKEIKEEYSRGDSASNEGSKKDIEIELNSKQFSKKKKKKNGKDVKRNEVKNGGSQKKSKMVPIEANCNSNGKMYAKPTVSSKNKEIVKQKEILNQKLVETKVSGKNKGNASGQEKTKVKEEEKKHTDKSVVEIAPSRRSSSRIALRLPKQIDSDEWEFDLPKCKASSSSSSLKSSKSNQKNQKNSSQNRKLVTNENENETENEPSPTDGVQALQKIESGSRKPQHGRKSMESNQTNQTGFENLDQSNLPKSKENGSKPSSKSLPSSTFEDSSVKWKSLNSLTKRKNSKKNGLNDSLQNSLKSPSNDACRDKDIDIDIDIDRDRDIDRDSRKQSPPDSVKHLRRSNARKGLEIDCSGEFPAKMESENVISENDESNTVTLSKQSKPYSARSQPFKQLSTLERNEKVASKCPTAKVKITNVAKFENSLPGCISINLIFSRINHVVSNSNTETVFLNEENDGLINKKFFSLDHLLSDSLLLLPSGAMAAPHSDEKRHKRQLGKDKIAKNNKTTKKLKKCNAYMFASSNGCDKCKNKLHVSCNGVSKYAAENGSYVCQTCTVCHNCEKKIIFSKNQIQKDTHLHSLCIPCSVLFSHGKQCIACEKSKKCECNNVNHPSSKEGKVSLLKKIASAHDAHVDFKHSNSKNVQIYDPSNTPSIIANDMFVKDIKHTSPSLHPSFLSVSNPIQSSNRKMNDSELNLNKQTIDSDSNLNLNSNGDRIKHVFDESAFQPFLGNSNPFLIFSDKNLCFLEACSICNGIENVKDDDDAFVICIDCGQSYHSYCLSPSIKRTPEIKSFYRCHSCKVCESCGGKCMQDASSGYCTVCNRCYHVDCLPRQCMPIQQHKLTGWVCPHCSSCSFCKRKLSDEECYDDKWYMHHDEVACNHCFHEKCLSPLDSVNAKSTKRLDFERKEVSEKVPLRTSTKRHEIPEFNEKENQNQLVIDCDGDDTVQKTESMKEKNDMENEEIPILDLANETNCSPKNTTPNQNQCQNQFQNQCQNQNQNQTESSYPIPSQLFPNSHNSPNYDQSPLIPIPSSDYSSINMHSTMNINSCENVMCQTNNISSSSFSPCTTSISSPLLYQHQQCHFRLSNGHAHQSSDSTSYAESATPSNSSSQPLTSYPLDVIPIYVNRDSSSMIIPSSSPSSLSSTSFLSHIKYSANDLNFNQSDVFNNAFKSFIDHENPLIIVNKGEEKADKIKFEKEKTDEIHNSNENIFDDEYIMSEGGKGVDEISNGEEKLDLIMSVNENAFEDENVNHVFHVDNDNVYNEKIDDDYHLLSIHSPLEEIENVLIPFDSYHDDNLINNTINKPSVDDDGDGVDLDDKSADSNFLKKIVIENENLLKSNSYEEMEMKKEVKNAKMASFTFLEFDEKIKKNINESNSAFFLLRKLCQLFQISFSDLLQICNGIYPIAGFKNYTKFKNDDNIFTNFKIGNTASTFFSHFLPQFFPFDQRKIRKCLSILSSSSSSSSSSSAPYLSISLFHTFMYGLTKHSLPLFLSFTFPSLPVNSSSRIKEIENKLSKNGTHQIKSSISIKFQNDVEANKMNNSFPFDYLKYEESKSLSKKNRLFIHSIPPSCSSFLKCSSKDSNCDNDYDLNKYDENDKENENGNDKRIESENENDKNVDIDKKVDVDGGENKNRDDGNYFALKNENNCEHDKNEQILIPMNDGVGVNNDNGHGNDYDNDKSDRQLVLLDNDDQNHSIVHVNIIVDNEKIFKKYSNALVNDENIYNSNQNGKRKSFQFLSKSFSITDDVIDIDKDECNFKEKRRKENHCFNEGNDNIHKHGDREVTKEEERSANNENIQKNGCIKNDLSDSNGYINSNKNSNFVNVRVDYGHVQQNNDSKHVRIHYDHNMSICNVDKHIPMHQSQSKNHPKDQKISQQISESEGQQTSQTKIAIENHYPLFPCSADVQINRKQVRELQELNENERLLNSYNWFSMMGEAICCDFEESLNYKIKTFHSFDDFKNFSSIKQTSSTSSSLPASSFTSSSISVSPLSVSSSSSFQHAYDGKNYDFNAKKNNDNENNVISIPFNFDLKTNSSHSKDIMPGGKISHDVLLANSKMHNISTANHGILSMKTLENFYFNRNAYNHLQVDQAYDVKMGEGKENERENDDVEVEWWKESFEKIKKEEFDFHFLQKANGCKKKRSFKKNKMLESYNPPLNVIDRRMMNGKRKREEKNEKDDKNGKEEEDEREGKEIKENGRFDEKEKKTKGKDKEEEREMGEEKDKKGESGKEEGKKNAKAEKEKEREIEKEENGSERELKKKKKCDDPNDKREKEKDDDKKDFINDNNDNDIFQIKFNNQKQNKKTKDRNNSITKNKNQIENKINGCENKSNGKVKKESCMLKNSLKKGNDKNRKKKKVECKHMRKDDRTCILCREGVGDKYGRMVYVLPDTWIHAFCLLWSNVIKSKSNSCCLSDAIAAIQSAQEKVCSVCNINFASIPCSFPHCSSFLHFPCLAKHGESLSVSENFCPAHASSAASKSDDIPLTAILEKSIMQKIVIYNDNENIREYDTIQKEGGDGTPLATLPHDTSFSISSPPLLPKENAQLCTSNQSQNQSQSQSLDFIQSDQDGQTFHSNHTTNSTFSSSPFPAFQPLQNPILNLKSHNFLDPNSHNSTHPKLHNLQNPNSQLLFRTGSLSVLHFGKVNWQNKRFFNSQFIFPIGFFGLRMFWSFKTVGHRAIYAVQIRSSSDHKPVFVIRLLREFPSNFHSAVSLDHGSGKRKKRKEEKEGEGRRKDRENDEDKGKGMKERNGKENEELVVEMELDEKDEDEDEDVVEYLNVDEIEEEEEEEKVRENEHEHEDEKMEEVNGKEEEKEGNGDLIMEYEQETAKKNVDGDETKPGEDKKKMNSNGKKTKKRKRAYKRKQKVCLENFDCGDCKDCMLMALQKLNENDNDILKTNTSSGNHGGDNDDDCVIRASSMEDAWKLLEDKIWKLRRFCGYDWLRKSHEEFSPHNSNSNSNSNTDTNINTNLNLNLNSNLVLNANSNYEMEKVNGMITSNSNDINIGNNGIEEEEGLIKEGIKIKGKNINAKQILNKNENSIFPVCNGVWFFGFQEKEILKRIENLDGSEYCLCYKFKFKNNPLNEYINADDGCARTKKFIVRGKERKNMEVAYKIAHDKNFSIMKQDDSSLAFNKSNSSPPTFGGTGLNLPYSLGTTDMDTLIEVPLAMQFRAMRQNLAKRTVIKSSQIHGQGLFALTPHKMNEMIVEYTGELIRSSVSDIREKQYKKEGVGCYFFTLPVSSTSSMIIDATRKGNNARFINHSCNANVYSRAITINGRRRLIIFARRTILPNEEFTMNYYLFSKEDLSKDQHARCFCKSHNCQGFMG